MSERDLIEALIRWDEHQDKQQRRRTRKRRIKKAALIVSAPIIGPMAGVWWAENDERGWR